MPRRYLLRNVKIYRVNQVCGADVTYIPMACGFAYLVAIMILEDGQTRALVELASAVCQEIAGGDSAGSTSVVARVSGPAVVCVKEDQASGR
jgi:hypothetical protein